VDANLITVLAGVLGSVAGASAAITTTWISQNSQTVRRPQPSAQAEQQRRAAESRALV